MNDVSIFVCCHRPAPIRKSSVLLPIQVGSALGTEKLDMIGDSEGENISDKNRFYCELTAQYWIWKNCRSNYVGLFHYRRFLNFKTKEKVFHTFGDNFAEKFGLTEAGVLALCRNYDVILPRKCPKGVSLYENYNNEHIAADLDAAVEIIGEKYPAMAETAEEVLRKSNEGYFMNILVTSKTFFDRYSAWLFDVLGELERRIQDDVVRRSDYQKRVYGFVAERLMNVYIAEDFGEEVLVIDAKNHIGGNSYDYYDKNNICIHKYGTHIFHTNLEHVWKYLSRFTRWHPYMHEVKGKIDGQEVPIPFNLNSIRKVFPKSIADKLEDKLIEKFGFNVKVPILELRKANDKDLEFLAEYVYQKVFLGYTLKQWGMKPEDLDPAVTGRVPVYVSKDNRYFQDKYQGIPMKGYSALIAEMLDHPKIKVLLNTDYASLENKESFERVFYSGPIDEYFGYELGELPYRSLRFDFVEYEREHFQSNSVINYPENHDFTRIGEYKYFLNDKSENTVVSFEYPEAFERGRNDRYYPIVRDENQNLYNRYLEKAKELKNVYFLGRLGDYKYYDMDKAVNRALALFDEVFAKKEKNNAA